MSTTSAPTEPQAPDPLAPDPRGRAKQRPGDLWFSGSALFAGSMILATLAAVAFFLIIQSIPALGAGSDEASLISTNFWDYVWPLLFGTVWAAFLALLPAKQDGIALRHAVEVRHESFQDPDFVELCRRHHVAIVCADHADYPLIADVTADFVYARLQTGSDDVATCYDEKRLDLWEQRMKQWAAGNAADGLPLAPAALATIPSLDLPPRSGRVDVV